MGRLHALIFENTGKYGNVCKYWRPFSEFKMQIRIQYSNFTQIYADLDPKLLFNGTRISRGLHSVGPNTPGFWLFHFPKLSIEHVGTDKGGKKKKKGTNFNEIPILD